jgi:hypothetical protein
MNAFGVGGVRLLEARAAIQEGQGRGRGVRPSKGRQGRQEDTEEHEELQEEYVSEDARYKTDEEREREYERWVGRGGLVVLDMPGYGKASREDWGTEILKYLQNRKQYVLPFVSPILTTA